MKSLSAKAFSSLIIFLHALFLFIPALRGQFPDLYDYILFSANFAASFFLLRGVFSDIDLALSANFLIMIHALLGRIIAPDNLTSGAALVVNLFVVYTALDLLRHNEIFQWRLFAAGYFALFVIFILLQQNAEPLFLAAIFALCGVARHPRLLSYFWAIVVAFTFCQPYAWESVIIFFLLLKVIFSIRSESDSILMRILFIAGLIVLFVIILPLIAVVLSEDPRNIFAVFQERRFISAIFNSFVSASISTIFLIIFFTPFAYVVSRSEFRFKNFIVSLSDLSIIVPESIAGIALLFFFGHQQPLGELLDSLFKIRFDGTFWGICLAQIFISLPFYLRTSLRAFESVPSNLELTAETLGSSRAYTLLRISLPLASRGIFLAAVLAFGRAAGVFGAVLLIAPNPETAPILVFNRFQSLGASETIPLVAALLVISLLLFILLQSISAKIAKENNL